VPSGIYFSRIRVKGKLIRRPLKTTSLTVAMLRLGDLEKVERQRVEVQSRLKMEICALAMLTCRSQCYIYAGGDCVGSAV